MRRRRSFHRHADCGGTGVAEERKEKLRERKKHHESEGYFRRKRYIRKLEPDHPGKACHHSGKNNRQQPPNAAQNDGYPPFNVSRNGHSPRRPPGEQHEVAALDPRFFGGNLVRALSRGLWRDGVIAPYRFVWLDGAIAPYRQTDKLANCQTDSTCKLLSSLESRQVLQLDSLTVGQLYNIQTF